MQNEVFYKYDNQTKLTTDNHVLNTKEIEKLTISVAVNKLSEEAKEILKDGEFEKAIKILAQETGAETTLNTLKKYIDYLKPIPTKTINGKVYKAGYKGFNIVTEGSHVAKLIDVTTDKNFVKLMFVTIGISSDDSVYLYYNISSNLTTTNHVIEMTKKIGKKFSIMVAHDVLPNGEYHALVANFQET